MEQDSTTLLFKVNSELMAVKRIWFSTGMQDVESPLKFGMVDNASINDHERDHGIVNSDWTNTGQSSELMTPKRTLARIRTTTGTGCLHGRCPLMVAGTV